MIVVNTADSAARSKTGGGVSVTPGTTDHNRKLKVMHALPFAVEYAVKSPIWLVAPSDQVSFTN